MAGDDLWLQAHTIDLHEAAGRGRLSNQQVALVQRFAPERLSSPKEPVRDALDALRAWEVAYEVLVQSMWTPLHLAAKNGREEVVELLMRVGSLVDPNCQTNVSDTAAVGA